MGLHHLRPRRLGSCDSRAGAPSAAALLRQVGRQPVSGPAALGHLAGEYLYANGEGRICFHNGTAHSGRETRITGKLFDSPMDCGLNLKQQAINTYCSGRLRPPAAREVRLTPAALAAVLTGGASYWNC